MTVVSEQSRIMYACDGVRITFPYPFRVFVDSDLTVILHTIATEAETILTLGTHYTVSGAGHPSGGDVTTLVAYSSAHRLIIMRVLPKTQPVDYREGDRFPAETHEQALDRLTYITQQLDERLDRAVLRAAAAAAGLFLPAPVAMAFLHSPDGQILRWTTISPHPLTWPLFAPDGTAIAPSYSFSLDPDTGIYRIGADILGFSTGGVERFRVEAGGNVRFAFQVQIVGGAPAVGRVLTSNATGLATWQTTNLSGDPAPRLSGELDAQANTIGFIQQVIAGIVGTNTINWRLGNKARFTFGAGNATLAFTAPSRPCNLILVLVQDSIGGRVMTWPATVRWQGQTTPVLSTAANAIDIAAFYFDGTNYFGQMSLNF